jgi:hypothetical protein
LLQCNIMRAEPLARASQKVETCDLLPAASDALHQPDKQQQDHRADGGVDNGRQDAATDRDVGAPSTQLPMKAPF